MTPWILIGFATVFLSFATLSRIRNGHFNSTARTRMIVAFVFFAVATWLLWQIHH